MAAVQVAEPIENVKEDKPVADAVAVAVINDSSAGLNRMYEDLAPLAARVRSAASILLLFSVFPPFIGTLEGMFGIIAACGVLCCAAPGSLGVAYAARCTKILATVSAVFSLMHVMCLTTFAVAVMPDVPHAFRHICSEGKLGLPPPVRGAHANDHLLFPAFAHSATGEHAEATIVAHEPPRTATFVATVATGAARRLQEMQLVAVDQAPVDPACARAERFFVEAAPAVLLCATLLEFGLFVAALSLAKASARLVNAARRYGANAI